MAMAALGADFSTDLKLKGFKAYEVDCNNKVVRSYDRKEFYKICLNIGTNVIHYADRTYETEGSILFFGNPRIPYSWQTVSAQYSGYACLFSGDFVMLNERSESLLHSPLFKIGGTPILNLSGQQTEFIQTIFNKILAEQDSDYQYKDDLIRNYIHLIIHEALKIQPSGNYSQHKNASSRITSVFFDLLERQFPIESTAHPLQLKTANDFPGYLAVHVNHLNRAVKEVTGKPTTAHISSRIVTEARALLQHTDWTVAEIAYSLGFEYPTYFNNYFKRVSGITPSALRDRIV